MSSFSTGCLVGSQKLQMASRFQVGGLKLANSVFLAPLEGVSCVGFRALCHKNGAGLTFTEMVRSNGIFRNNKATLDLIDTFDESTPTGLQILSKSPTELKSVLAKLELLSRSKEWHHFRNICAVDLNLGCPSPEVIKEGAGPSLLKRKARLLEMFYVLSEWKQSSDLPGIKAVGCKIRLGLNISEKNHKVYLSVLESAAAAGLDWITIHGRHAKQRSREPADWTAIAEACHRNSELQILPPSPSPSSSPSSVSLSVDAAVTSKSSLLVFGNGDITGVDAAERIVDETRCDGIMVARAAIRNPWVFEGLAASSSTRTSPVSLASEADSSSSSSSPAAGASSGRLSSSRSSAIRERWPTEDEVRAAQADYRRTAQKYNTKPKYVQFHEDNFSRLIRGISDKNAPVIVPKNIHL